MHLAALTVIFCIMLLTIGMINKHDPDKGNRAEKPTERMDEEIPCEQGTNRNQRKGKDEEAYG